VVDQVFDRLAEGQDIPFAKLQDVGRRFRRRVLRFPSRALNPLFLPQRDGFLHEVAGAASGAGGKRGKLSFLIGREMNFHAIQGSIHRRGVKVGNKFNVMARSENAFHKASAAPGDPARRPLYLPQIPRRDAPPEKLA
jgi:hypothetical protein